MKIEIKTKFDVGDTVYYLYIKPFDGIDNYKGYIYNYQISSIRFKSRKKYDYEVYKNKYISEDKLYSKLSDAKQAAIDLGYSVKGKRPDIKYLN